MIKDKFWGTISVYLLTFLTSYGHDYTRDNILAYQDMCELITLRSPRIKSDDFDLVRQFLFLESKLSKKRESVLHKKIKEYSLKGGVSLVASFVCSKLLEYFFWRRIKSGFIQNMVTWFTPGACTYEAAYNKINKLFFWGMIPTFLFILAQFPWSKEQTALEILQTFVKYWPVNQINTPDRFYNTFDTLYETYLHEKSLMMSETCAKKILQYIHDETVNFISNKNNIYHLHFEIEGMQKKLVTLNITDEVREEVQKIIDQLKNSIVFSAETAMLQNHVEWLVNLPWGIETEDNTNLVHAKLILDQEHFGLEDVKEKVLDYLAIKAFKKDCKGQVLCLCGPPGVGKTSIGKSIAKALGKRFFRISLGGLHDESEIRGHRKTYVGAMPGRLIQAIKNVGSCNPLIMLDEIDKMGKSVNGDPCAALLEVFDPEQNIRFYDNYLGVPFDLSHVMFIATANYIENIPKPLQDRMEMVMLRGYTAEEKLEITKRHLLPKAIKESGLEEKGFTVDNSILINLITQHSHEGGVREIDRHIKKLCAKFVRRLLEDECLTK